MSEYSILPAKPWLPMPWNLPFQPSSGSQTSMLIVGVIVACTRQKARIVVAAVLDEQVGALLPKAYGPAGTSFAERMSVSGRSSFTRSAQFIGPSSAAATPKARLPQAATASSVHSDILVDGDAQ